MAQWRDLPTELKEAIIGHLGDSEDVKEGKRDSVDFQALLTMSQVDRTMYLIARAYLWKRIDVSSRSRKSIQQFSEAVLPTSRLFISQIVCFRRFRCTYEDEIKTMAACGILISLAPSVKSLSLGVGDWSAALPDDVLGSLEQLNVEETDDPVKMELDNYFTAETVRRCPNLRVLVCDSYDRQGMKELYDRIRDLKYLEDVTLWDGACPGLDELSQYLAGPWTGPLAHFSTNLLVDAPILQGLAISVGATLQSLTVPSLPRLPLSIAPLEFPQLGSLTVTQFEEDSPSQRLRVFDASPLQYFDLDALCHTTNSLNRIREFIMHHQSTLIRLHFGFWGTESAEKQESLDSIAQLCSHHGIAFAEK